VLGALDTAPVIPGLAPAVPPTIPVGAPATGPLPAAPPAAGAVALPDAGTPTVTMAAGEVSPRAVSYAVAHHSRRGLTVTLLGLGLLIVLLMAAGDRIRAMQ
jgi:hypothetical protein